MQSSKDEKFKAAIEGVLALKNLGLHKEAIEAVIDASTQRLRAEFRFDGNHSWYLVGDSYFKQGNFSDALEAFRRALRCWPNDHQSMWAIADCYSELKAPERAEKYYRRARANGGATDKLTYNIGNALFDQRRYSEALTEYRKIGRSDRDLHSLAVKNIELASQACGEKNRLKGKRKGKGAQRDKGPGCSP